MKRFLAIATLGLASSLFITACNNSNETKTADEEVATPVQKKQMGDDETGIAIAFYYQDSIATQFNLYIEIDSILKVKETNFQKELEGKYRAYQAYEADTLQSMQAYEFTGYQIV